MESSLEQISNSKQKKVDRKLKKFQHIVKKETGITCTATPSENLVICNAGLVNGLTEETVFKHFNKFGTITKIILLSGKSCCFLSYNSSEASLNAYNAYNGSLNIAQDCKPVYLLFAEKLPDVKENKIWEPQKYPQGLILIEDFITTEEEDKLLKLCNFEGQTMRHRLVKHFGFEFRYDINNVDKGKPLEAKIPAECDFLWERLAKGNLECKNFVPDQLTINHYAPGQGIPHHVDTHSAFEDPIVCLSLNAATVMEFKKENRHVCVLLPRRSFLVMSGESRYDWTHGIVPRKYDVIPTKIGYTSLERGTRISFTFRKVLNGACRCVYKDKCDSYKKGNKIDNVTASKLESLHVQDVYEVIADHFSDTRHKPWPNVLKFVESFDKGSILIDVGCGNGKYLGRNLNIFDLGCDTSLGLANICKQRKFEIFNGNCLNVPLRNEIADGIISIAVIHHMANEDRRFLALKEIARLLRNGGRALIYVWAKDQLKDEEKSSYIKQDRKNRKGHENADIGQSEEVSVLDAISLPIHTNRTQFKTKDVLVPWKLKDQQENTYFRYYHVFDEHELENLCAKLPNVIIEKSYYDQGNWCVILKKIN